MTSMVASRGIVALLLAYSLMGCTPAKHDAAYYLHHDSDREAKLRDCGARGTQTSDPECIAANRADAEKHSRAPSVLSSPL